TEAQRKVDYDYQLNFANSAKEKGVDDFIFVCAYAASPNSRIFYSRIKGEPDEALKEPHFNKLTIFSPGMLDRQDSERTGEVVGGKIIKFANRLGILEQQKPLPTPVLTKAMINAARIKSNGYSKIKLGNIFSFAEKKNG